MVRSLRDPVVMAGDGGLTLLTGRNVDLAPPPVAASASRLSGPGRLPPGALELLAFARGRSGLVGCRGSVTAGPDGAVLGDLEPFGPRSGLGAFGRDLAAFVARPGRFDASPRVALREGACCGARLLAEGLQAGGLALEP